MSMAGSDSLVEVMVDDRRLELVLGLVDDLENSRQRSLAPAMPTTGSISARSDSCGCQSMENDVRFHHITAMLDGFDTSRASDGKTDPCVVSTEDSKMLPMVSSKSPPRSTDSKRKHESIEESRNSQGVDADHCRQEGRDALPVKRMLPVIPVAPPRTITPVRNGVSIEDSGSHQGMTATLCCQGGRKVPNCHTTLEIKMNLPTIHSTPQNSAAPEKNAVSIGDSAINHDIVTVFCPQDGHGVPTYNTTHETTRHLPTIPGTPQITPPPVRNAISTEDSGRHHVMNADLCPQGGCEASICSGTLETTKSLSRIPSSPQSNTAMGNTAVPITDSSILHGLPSELGLQGRHDVADDSILHATRRLPVTPLTPQISTVTGAHALSHDDSGCDQHSNVVLSSESEHGNASDNDKRKVATTPSAPPKKARIEVAHNSDNDNHICVQQPRKMGFEHVRCLALDKESQPSQPERLNFDQLSSLHDLGVGDICVRRSEPNCLLEICQLMKKSSQVIALCTVLVPLHETTIEGAADQLLSNNYPWKYAALAYPKFCPLSELELAIRPPGDLKTNLIWKPHAKGMAGGWKHFAYMLGKKTSTRFSVGRRPAVLDLFAGCGSVGLGFRTAGLDVAYAIEEDKMAAATISWNQKATSHVLEVDARTVMDRMINNEMRLGELDCIHASLPSSCVGGKEDRRKCLVQLSVEYVRYLHPKVFTFEDIMGIVDESSSSLYRELVASLIALGYQVRGCKVNAANYGDPQYRESVVLIAVQNGYGLPSRPTRSHGKGTNQRHVTARDAIGDLELIEVGSIPNHTKLGKNYREIALAHAVNCCQILEAGKPARTIQCEAAVRHYRLHRAITPRERARLKGFPDDYTFMGTYTQQCSQIGNAVPIGLATAIGKVIASCFVNETTCTV